MVGLLATAASNKDFQRATGKAVRLVGTAVAGFVGYKLLQNLYQNFARSQAQHQLLKSRAARQAQQLKMGMNPSGFDWLMAADGTNENTIFNAAKSIQSFSEVQRKYRQLYPGRNLIEDLEAELDSEDLTKFYGFMQKGQVQNIARSAKPTNTYKFEVGKRVFANGKPFMYSFPEVGAESFQILERNAPLGKVAKRLSKKDGNWYLVNMGKGISPYFKEADLF